MLTKKEIQARLTAISMNTPDTAKKLSHVAEIVFGIGAFIGIIFGILGISSFIGNVFIAIITIVIGAIIFLTYWLASLMFEGFSEIIKNTYISAESSKLQIEILAGNAMKGEINKIDEDSLPQL